MSDPKYPEYNGVLRFDDENVVEVGLEPDTENIKVKLNGTEVSGGGGAGGDEVCVVKISEDPETGDLVADKTYAEIASHLDINTPVILVYQGMVNILSAFDATDYTLIFRSIPYITENEITLSITCNGITVSPDDQITLNGGYTYVINRSETPT